MLLRDNFARIQENIGAACEASGREVSSVTMVAVSKKQVPTVVQEYISLCQQIGTNCILGENYVQEFATKKRELSGIFQSHGIGHLQRNKVKTALELFDVIESVDSMKIALEINKHALACGKVFPVFLEINISDDSAKHGFPAEVEAFKDLFNAVALRVVGLMTITKFYEDPNQARPDFQKLAMLGSKLRKDLNLPRPLELSMGMSADYVQAIEEGATVVRIGSALFGERK